MSGRIGGSGLASSAASTHAATETLRIAGRTVSFRVSGRAGRQGVVLVHGGAAHGGWWDDVAADLAVDHHIAVIDMTGHGDSSWSGTYSFDGWADEVLAVAERVSEGGAPVLVGHSMGALVCLRAASRDVALLGVVIADSVVRDYPPEELESWLRHADSPPRVYPSPDEILRRFTLNDQAPYADPDVVRRIGLQGIRPLDGGWTWKFDRRTFRDTDLSPKRLRPVRHPVEIIRGQLGEMSSDVCEVVCAGIACDAPVHTVPGAAHHVMLDRPDALLTVLREVLNRWRRAPRKSSP